MNAFGFDSGNAITLSVTDSQSNTYTVDSTNTGSLANLIARTLATSSSALTITVASTKLALISFAIYEINTGGAVFSLDSVATGTGITGTTLSTSSLALTGVDCVIAGFGMNLTGLTYTPGSSFTINYSSNTNSAFVSESYINTTGSSVVPSITTSVNSIWNGAAVAYVLNLHSNVYDSDISTSLQIQQDFRSPAQHELGISNEYQIKSIFNYEISLSLESSYITSTLFIVTDSSSPVESSMTIVSSSGANDLGIGIESNFDITASIPVTDFVDSAIAIDQQTVLNFFINIDTSISTESTISSKFIYRIDSATADLDTQKVSTGTIRMIVSYDNPAIGLDSQSTHNVLAAIDADSASGSESQVPIFLAFYGTEIASTSESSQREILAGDLSVATDRQLFISLMFTSADQANEQETQLITIIGGLSVTIFDTNITTGTEAWLTVVSMGDSGLSREINTQFTSFLTSGLTDAATGQESSLPIYLSVDSPVAQELNLKLILFVSIDSAQAIEAFTYSQLIIQNDLAIVLEKNFLTNSLITTGESIIESALGNETQFPIRLYSEFVPVLDTQYTNIFQSQFTLGSDLTQGIESQLRIIIGLENPLALDIPFVFFSTMTTSSVGAESIFWQESPLRINLGSESPKSTDIEIRTFLDSDSFFAMDQQILFNFSITFTEGFTESVLASEAQLPIRFFGDFGSSADGNEATTGQITIPPPSTTSITDVLVGLFIYLNSTGVVGPNSVDFVIDPDSIILYPTNPGPILLIQPMSLTDASDTIGGGRFSKTWNWDIIIHVIIDNIYDQAFKDMIISESQSHFTGPFQIAYQVQKLVEQAYLVNSNYQPVTIEFPYFLSTDKIRRYKGANSYVGLPLRFSVVFRDNLPSLNIP